MLGSEYPLGKEPADPADPQLQRDRVQWSGDIRRAGGEGGSN